MKVRQVLHAMQYMCDARHVQGRGTVSDVAYGWNGWCAVSWVVSLVRGIETL